MQSSQRQSTINATQPHNHFRGQTHYTCAIRMHATTSHVTDDISEQIMFLGIALSRLCCIVTCV